MPRDYVPRAYGPGATDFLLQLPRCNLFAGMGMGKTVITLTAIDLVYAMGEMSKPTLILGPLRVARTTWKEQAAEWSHLSSLEVNPIVGTQQERTRAAGRDVAIHTTNYENIPWLVSYWGNRWPYGWVVADESTRLKSFRGSMQTSSTGKQFLRKAGGLRARSMGSVAHKSERWTNLTGTPSPNGLQDLWGQQWFVDAGARLGRTYSSFEQRYFRTGYNGYGIEPLPFAMPQIQDAIRDTTYTLDPEDWFDLADPIVHTIEVDLPPNARRLYRDMERDLYLQIDGRDAEAKNAASKTQKLLQLANGAIYLDHDADNDNHPKAKDWKEVHNAKLEALDSLVTEMAGATLLVAYQFRSDLDRLKRAFPAGRHISSAMDEADLKAGRIPVAFVHPRSLGHGVDGIQHVCNTAVFFGHDWDLEDYLQIIERIGPMRQLQSGTGKATFLYHIVARDTADEDVMLRRETKGRVQDAFKAGFKRRNGNG
ncbi:HepA Superfamily II DNA/RNA helicases, SNF2 family [uncultured Caudovirales phage]|uniref:HepA Superfamily II DNA/RNA helicases, SNF2 family n=1 Tax=uncultured Caudovirales phage TaxID=2100421 RepID=A0A6J5SF97_9CAUD|nr:HepA Superfamily II DNA/RNA helicases, SNF2 family [uncultured Caudovirales phage]CAB4212709.1 HepA Superfamily II DNA/RNA helicases, SNF2 family [uncultured Caudovirales phage]